MQCSCKENDACSNCHGNHADKVSILRTAVDQARRMTSSDPNHIYCYQATMILDHAYWVTRDRY